MGTNPHRRCELFGAPCLYQMGIADGRWLGVMGDQPDEPPGGHVVHDFQQLTDGSELFTCTMCGVHFSQFAAIGPTCPGRKEGLIL
eukprot:g47566.t1